MKYIYKPVGVCSTSMEFIINGDIIDDLMIKQGCAGNAIGISHLVKGQKIDDVIEKLEGISCGNKKTSCPDQIANALKQYKEKRN